MAEFIATKTDIPGQTNRIEPELGFIIFTLNMNVYRFVSIARVKEKPVWTDSQYCRHLLTPDGIPLINLCPQNGFLDSQFLLNLGELFDCEGQIVL